MRPVLIQSQAPVHDNNGYESNNPITLANATYMQRVQK